MKKLLLLIFSLISLCGISQNFQYDLENDVFIMYNDSFIVDTGNVIGYIAKHNDTLLKFEDSVIVAGVGEVLHIDAANSDTATLSYNATGITVTSINNDTIKLSGNTGILEGLMCRFSSAVTGITYMITDTIADDSIIVSPMPVDVIVTDEIFRGCESNFVDLSPYKNNGVQTTASQQPALLWYGTDSCCYSFDGSNDYFCSSSTINDLATTRVGTWSIWVKFTTPPTYTQMGLLEYSHIDAVRGLFSISKSYYKLRMAFKHGLKDGWIVTSNDTALYLNEWVHYAAVQDGVMPVVYINGVAVPQTILYYPYIATNTSITSNWFFGVPDIDSSSIPTHRPYWQTPVNIKNVIIYNCPLTATQIFQLYEDGKP